METYRRLAKAISYGVMRALNSILYIVIHYTGNTGDTAKNNADFFATGNTRSAGAHYFVDRDGNVANSVPLHRSANAVGMDMRNGRKGEAKYYGKCTNINSVSIELCDCADKQPSYKQMEATRQLVKRIRKKCVHARTIIRHWDVNGKECPALMVGVDNTQWERLHSYLEHGYVFKARVVKKAAVRSSGKVTAKNKIGTIDVGKRVNITKVVGKWGRLKEKDASGRFRWITLSKLREL